MCPLLAIESGIETHAKLATHRSIDNGVLSSVRNSRTTQQRSLFSVKASLSFLLTTSSLFILFAATLPRISQTGKSVEK
jgi:hypothetical protein